VSLALASRRAAISPSWVRNALWRNARAVPSLDLQFADTKSLADAISGQNLITFTRASSATYVGSDGLIKTATTNLLLRSEEFDNASWSKVNTTITPDAIAAPTGAITADLVTDSNDGAAVIHSTTTTNQSFASGLSYTVSVYAKAGTQPGVDIILPSAAFTSTLSARFNISTGAVASSSAGVTASIVNIGNDWYRCVATATATATVSSSTTVQIRIATASTSFYQGNGTGTIYLWGAQLEQSSTVGEYIPTTSVINSAPRFDHNPTTGESLGLLVEEQRTNLLPRSEEFDNASWTKNNLTVSANSSAAPDGLTTADKLVEDTATGNHRIFAATTSLAANTSHTLSIYVKAAGRTVIRVELRDSLGGFAVQDFNLTTLAITSAGSGTGTISSLGNGWYRCTVTGTSSASGGVGTVLFWALQTAGSTSYTGDGTSGLFLWGAQLEAGAFPTSYIPTTTATVTRSADVASITGTNFSSWYRQDEGTVFASYSLPNSLTIAGARVFNIQNTAGTSQIWLRMQGGTNRLYEVTDGGAQQAVLSAGNFSANTLYKGVIAVRANDFAFSDNGSTPLTDTLGTLGTPVQMGIGMDTNGSAPLCGHIRRLTYWPTRLANPTLQALTQ
jgi:hypothetical protein